MSLDRPAGLEIDNQMTILSTGRKSGGKLGIEQLHTVVVNGPLSAVPRGERAIVRTIRGGGIDRRPESSIPARLLI
jgi:hypothetical protein